MGVVGNQVLKFPTRTRNQIQPDLTGKLRDGARVAYMRARSYTGKLRCPRYGGQFVIDVAGVVCKCRVHTGACIDAVFVVRATWRVVRSRGYLRNCGQGT